MNMLISYIIVLPFSQDYSTHLLTYKHSYADSLII